MGYGIMRIEKRGRGAVYGLQIEANRTVTDHERGRDFDKSDIDWERTADNLTLKRTDNWNKEISAQINEAGCKERKDSIVMLDGLYTASPEWMATHSRQEQESYFRDCLDFHIREYCGGDENRILNAVIHYDESSPHMQVASVPICEDEKGFHLSAKKIMGNRTDYQKRQDQFFEQVSRSRGLERGETSTGRKHHILTQEYKLERQKQRITAQNAEIEAKTEKLEKTNEKSIQAEKALKKAQRGTEREMEKIWNAQETLIRLTDEVTELEREGKGWRQANRIRQERMDKEIEEASQTLSELEAKIEYQKDEVNSYENVILEQREELDEIAEKIDLRYEALDRVNNAFSPKEYALESFVVRHGLSEEFDREWGGEYIESEVFLGEPERERVQPAYEDEELEW